MMFKLGVTGGIGTGKSVVCRVFEILGIPVFYSDARAKWLMESDQEIIERIAQSFGEGILSGGKPDRKVLADIVFKDAHALEQLNAIVHPAVEKDFQGWVARLGGAAYLVKEAAILFESGAYKQLDYIVSVSAPVSLRIERIISRDGLTEQQVRERMHNQLSQEEIDRRADVVFYNDEERVLLPQIIALHEKILGKELFL